MELTVPREADGQTLETYLRAALRDMPRWAIEETLRARDVRRGKERLAPDAPVCGGETLRVYLPKRALEQARPALSVVFEDAHVLLVSKPQGVSVQEEDGSDDMISRARAYVRAQRGDENALRLCHRLDANTGGLLLFARDAAAYDAACEAFAQHAMDKRYVCRVEGCPQPEEALLKAYLIKDAAAAHVRILSRPAQGALPIRTAYRVLEPGEISRVEVRLYTGRTHQIRAHMAFIGHPIIGDDKYGNRALNKREGIRRQQLWATDLTVHAGGALAYLQGRHFHDEAPF